MLNRFIFFLLILNFFLIDSIQSQNTKKATKFYLEGNSHYSVGDFDSAIEFFLKSLKSDPDFCPSIYKLGLSYKRKNLFQNYKNMFLAYNDKICEENKDDVNYHLGEIFFLSGEMNTAKHFFDSVSDTLKFMSLKKYKNNILYNIQNSDIQEIVYDKYSSINKWLYQYSPSFDKKSKTLYFTIREGGNLFDDENIITSSLQKKEFIDFKPYYFLNTQNNEGSPTISDDGNLMVYTSCKMDFKKNSCDLFYLEKVNGFWTKPKKLDQNINSSYWDSQPFIYKDKLFFVSNRPGGKGGRDIYYSKINNDGSFTNAVNFDIVNTSYEEVSPSYFEDIFYFSSNNESSYGGYDIYLLDNYSNKPITNLGSSINSHLDETSINLWDDYILLTKEDRLNQINKSEILFGQITRPYKKASKKITFKTFDNETKEEIVSNLFLIKGDEKIKISNEVSYNMELFSDSEILAESKGYFPQLIKEINKDTNSIYLDRLDKKIVTRNIYFEFDSYSLNNDSKKFLSIISDWLITNTFKSIEIAGHTDDIGSKEYNYELSLKRAKSVFDFLLKKNPTIKNLIYKGYGSSIPIKSNYIGPDNRRIEFKITY